MKILVFLSFVILVSFACNNASNSNAGKKEQNASTPKKATTVATVDGKAVYKNFCVFCHGADGKQQLNGAKDLTASTLSEKETLQVITKGRNTMAAYENTLDEKELKAVAAYVMTLRNK